MDLQVLNATKTFVLVLLLSTFANFQSNVTSMIQDDCPSVSVDVTDERPAKQALVFKAKVSQQTTPATLTYKWKVVGGEIRRGQGTTRLIVAKLPKESLTVVLEIGGLAKDCPSTTSITMSH